MASISTTALAQDLPADGQIRLGAILVRDTADPAGPARLIYTPASAISAPAADGGTVLRTIPGVTAGRMGGLGLEPVIRGQSQNQLNIIDAGSFTYGACPNRMDPPASTALFGLADRVIVERGYQSVTNGPGGSGGAVILERDAPEFVAGKRWRLDTTLGGDTNADTRDAGLKGAYDLGGGFYLKGFAQARGAGNYDDGNGDEVAASYDREASGITLGYARDGVDLALDVERDTTTNVRYAGAGMDSPWARTDVMRLRGGVDLDFGALKRVEGSLYSSQVDHVMDSYSLRPVTGMVGLAPSSSDTVGGKIEAQLDFGTTTAKIGVDAQSNNRNAILYSGMLAAVDAESPSVARFLMWPDVTIAQYGLYAQSETALSDRITLTLGARYDRVVASADAADQLPGGAMMTPNQIYAARYGTTFADDRTEDNLGGLMRLEYGLSDNTTLFAGLSRSVRTADATERAMARTDWVGNPDIAPEKHHQIDLGVETAGTGAGGGAWQLGAAAYADDVQDFILRDAFSVPGVTTYRNIHANLAGVELEALWRRGNLELTGDATYTHGTNRDDDRALAQIPPLSGRIAVSWGQDDWRLGARVNWANRQDRIDPSRDVRKTPGYATLDVFGRYQIAANTTLLAGVNNVTDVAYYNHVSRDNVFDPAPVQVGEAGRSLFVTLQSSF